MIGNELGTERLAFLFCEKNFERVEDSKKIEYTKEIAGLLNINYDDLCLGRSEGKDPFPVTDSDIQSAIKTIGEKYNINVLAMRWQTTEYVQDSDGADTDAQEWWAFAYVEGKDCSANISDVNNFYFCNKTDWSPVVLDDYSGEGIIEKLSIELTDTLDCDDGVTDFVFGAVEELFISICGEVENWVNIDDVEDLDLDDE